MNPHAIDHDLQPLYDIMLDNQRRQLFELQRERHRLQHQQEARDSFSISRAIGAMAEGARLHGADEQFLQRSAEEAGKAFDPSRVQIPFNTLSRDLVIATGTSGGYLKAGTTAEAFDSLRPWSVVMRGGVQVLPGLQGDLAVNRTTSSTTVSWMANEGSAATPAQPVIGQNIVLSPKIAIGVVQISRQLRLMSDADAWISRELLRTAATIVDQAVLNGSGSSGQPLGILNTTNVGTQSGTSLAWSGVLSMKRLASVSNVPDESISFLTTPAIRATLEGRERATGSGFIWDSGKVAGCNAFATSDMPSATMLCGPLDQVLLGIWTNGLQLEINPYDPTLFKSGVVQARVLLGVDLGLMCDPAAFTKSSSIT